MPNTADNLKSFIERIRSINWFQRIFHWQRVKNHLIDVASELSTLLTQLENLETDKIDSGKQLSDYKKNLDLAIEKKYELQESEKRVPQFD
jgi:hypothetical protein